MSCSVTLYDIADLAELKRIPVLMDELAGLEDPDDPRADEIQAEINRIMEGSEPVATSASKVQSGPPLIPSSRS